MVTESNREISFVIEKYLGVLSEEQNGWRKELNLVSWNGKKAKLDIREWSPDHTRMTKGITLRYEEARALQRSLYRWFTGYGKPVSEKPRAEVSAEPAEESLAGAAVSEPSDQEFFAAVTDPETGEIFETVEREAEEFFDGAAPEPAEPGEMAASQEESAETLTETSDF